MPKARLVRLHPN